MESNSSQGTLMRVVSWPYIDRPMTAETISAMYDVKSFRIGERRYPPGTALDGRTRAATWFVLKGACRVKFDEEFALRTGDVVEVATGDFSLAVLGNDELHLVQVWDLRPHMN
jgi:mannose-6-phosphate isomerase-like protein (cupin superfamily)